MRETKERGGRRAGVGGDGIEAEGGGGKVVGIEKYQNVLIAFLHGFEVKSQRRKTLKEHASFSSPS